MTQRGLLVLDADVKLIDDFATRHGLVWAIDTSNCSPVIIGENDSRVYVFDEGQRKLAVAFIPDETPEGYAATMRELLDAEFDLVHDNPCESYLAYDAANERQGALTVKVCGLVSVKDSAKKRATMRDVIEAARLRNRKQAEAKQDTKRRKLTKLGIEYDPDTWGAVPIGCTAL